MTNHRGDTIQFPDTNKGVSLMATFMAQLTKEGVVFVVKLTADGYSIRLTGGY